MRNIFVESTLTFIRYTSLSYYYSSACWIAFSFSYQKRWKI